MKIKGPWHACNRPLNVYKHAKLLSRLLSKIASKMPKIASKRIPWYGVVPGHVCKNTLKVCQYVITNSFKNMKKYCKKNSNMGDVNSSVFKVNRVVQKIDLVILKYQ